MGNLDVVVVFPTTHLTLSAERSLERAGIRYRTVMKPRKISSDCGLAIRIDAEAVDRSGDFFAADGLLPVRFFREREGQWECVRKIGD